MITRSSAETELRSLTHNVCEIWLRNLLGELKQQGNELLELYCDNKTAISIIHNPVYHDRTKHVGINCHFIKEKIEDGMGSMICVLTLSQIVDIFIKSF